jgi:hypothetical protein
MQLLNQPSIHILPVRFRNLSNHTTVEDPQSCFTLIMTDRFHGYTKHEETLVTTTEIFTQPPIQNKEGFSAAAKAGH